jgi:hypothetical protein
MRRWSLRSAAHNNYNLYRSHYYIVVFYHHIIDSADDVDCSFGQDEH